jgi:Fic family protein
MHIEKRKEGKKNKYYLAHSYREGKKVHKIRKFLGKDIDEITLKERVNKARKIILEEISKYNLIKDPMKNPLSEKEIKWIENLEKGIELKINHLSEKDWIYFSEIFSYNTNAIEGSKLTKKEVRNILEKNKWSEDSSKEDIAETYGVSESIKLIRKSKENITVDFIKKIHKVVFKNSKSFAGELRKKGEEVVVMGASGIIVHEGAPQVRVIYLLKELVNWYNKNKKKYPGLVLAAVVHNQFENVHPFADGNGRVGRILLNNILIKNNLPPINIDLTNRQEYYSSLQEYQKKGNLKPTIDLLIKEYKKLKKTLGDHKKKKM